MSVSALAFSEGIFFLGRHFYFPVKTFIQVKLRNHSGLQGKDDTRMVTSCEVSYKDWDGY